MYNTNLLTQQRKLYNFQSFLSFNPNVQPFFKVTPVSSTSFTSYNYTHSTENYPVLVSSCFLKCSNKNTYVKKSLLG